MDFEKYPHIQQNHRAMSWLRFEQHRGLAENTIQTYTRGLEDFLCFCAEQQVMVIDVRLDLIGLYINEMKHRALPDNVRRPAHKQAVGLSQSTMQQRLTIVRRFFDYLEEDGDIERNPVRRGRFDFKNPTGGERGLIPVTKDLPWIPNQSEWEQIIKVVQSLKLRDKLIFALSYDAALRREEVCGLHIGDLDFAHHLLTVRAEITKSRRTRVIPYTPDTGQLLRFYLRERAQITREAGALFLSVSPRNYGVPIKSSIWSKTVRQIALKSKVDQFTPHTLRHLRLTDLARAGVAIHDIATFAGHQSINTTMTYIHLSGTDLAQRVNRQLQDLDLWRLKDIQGNGDDY